MELLDFTFETWLFMLPDAAPAGLPAPSPAVAALLGWLFVGMIWGGSVAAGPSVAQKYMKYDDFAVACMRSAVVCICINVRLLHNACLPNRTQNNPGTCIKHMKLEAATLT